MDTPPPEKLESEKSDFFRLFAHKTAEAAGTRWAFVIALLIIVVWIITGPYFEFSNTWQLVINTGTTIVTFLMVFLIQNTQNRESKATQLKLDEIIRAIKPARNDMIDLEDQSDVKLEKFAEEFRKFRKEEEEKPKL